MVSTWATNGTVASAVKNKIASLHKRASSTRTLSMRTLLHRTLLALLLGSVTLGGIAPAGLAPAAAPAAQTAAAAAGAAASATGADPEQPQSWLLKWHDPALAHELRGTEVLSRQNEAAVMLVRPAAEGADVQDWLRRLRGLPGVEYVHPNYGVHILALPASEAEAAVTAVPIALPAPKLPALSSAMQLAAETPHALALPPATELAAAVAPSPPAPSALQPATKLAAATAPSAPIPSALPPATKLAAAAAPSAPAPSALPPATKLAAATAPSAPAQSALPPATKLAAATAPSAPAQSALPPATKLAAAAAPSAPAQSALPPATKLASAAAPSAPIPSALPPATQLAAAAAPQANDPELQKQRYLTQIGATKAWETVREQQELTIAIVDTGVDLDHPDLKDNLVPGANLVSPGEQPDDDNGHGTSVAGVIAAAGNNGIGVSGIVWKAKIMPIKALDNHGDGTEQELGEAILYAVRSGARIIVLSVGLHRYSPYMLDIVNYAESKNVLLVAASGNDGVSLGEKAAVKYPAAYPTVLAVGGAKANNTVDSRSNQGTELDLVAPWDVYTTALGGLYKKEEGTSMAAPQAAAAAALVWARYKNLLPYQIRGLLRQTAKDIGAPGVDSSTGYGMLQIDQAVRATFLPDGFEPNNSNATAARFPLNTQISAVLQGTNDHDWYRIDTPFDGTLTIQYKGLVASGKAVPPVRFTQYTNGVKQSVTDTKLASRSIDIEVPKGQHLIHLELINQSSNDALPYLLTSDFTIKADDYEKNDKADEAFTIQPRTQSITGNFHLTADRDWFSVTFTQSGKLSLALSTNTARIDPGLGLQRAEQQLLVYDDEGEGQTEQSPVITVTPGKYYIRVHNTISSEASPAIGTYKLRMDYTPKYDDPNEPNDKSYEAFMINPDTEYLGVIGSYSDVDWFQFRISSPSIVSMTISGVPNDIALKLQVYDKRMKQLTSAGTGESGKLQSNDDLLLQPGVYYAKLTADEPFDKQYYHVKIKSEELIAGFRDIKDHWAQNDIIALNKSGIINGTGGNRFEPKRAITRAEAVAMVVKAYKPISSGTAQAKRFGDVSANHWADDAIAVAVVQGWIKGFPDGTFKPDQPVTRTEMALIIGYADSVKPQLPLVEPFADVSKTHWSAPMLFAMRLNGQIEGVQTNLFKPKQQASRADFTVLLHRVIT